MPRLAKPTIDRTAERRLRHVQKRIAEASGPLLDERNALLVDMHELGYSQDMLAEMLTAANTRVGQGPITQSAVQKAIRYERERTTAARDPRRNGDCDEGCDSP